jgi:hypothetical protein
MFRAFASKEGEFAAAEALRNRPNARLYEIVKLAIQTTESSLSKQEEAFFGRWQRYIPGVAGSGRAYVTFLNRMRADVFDTMVETLKNANGEIDVEAAKIIADFVNTMTGRGGIGRHGAGADILATYFFAPRYMASRFQILTFKHIRTGTAATRVLAAKEYARALSGLGVFYAACAIGGLFSDDEEDKPQFEWDWRSTEFGKVRYGDVIVDPLAGFSQTTVLLTRVLGGKTKMSTGEIVPIRGKNRPFNGLTTADAISRFLRGKLAPAPGAIVNILAGENIIGEPVTPLSAAKESLIPLSFGDIYDVMHAKGFAKKSILGVMVVFGVSANNYQNATADRFAEKITEHGKLKGRSKETGKDFDYETQVSQVIAQAKKRGLSEKDLLQGITSKGKAEGMDEDTIRKRRIRLRKRY